MSESKPTAVSLLDREVKVDLKTLFKALSKFALGVVTRNTDEVVKQAIDTAAAFGLTTPAGPDRAREHAAILVARALNRGIGELIGDHIHLFGYDPLVRRPDLVPTTAPTVDPDDISVTFELDSDLFDKPERAPFVEALHHSLKAWLVYHHLTDAAASTIAVRLGHYYAAALAREWRDNDSAYPDVADFLASAATPIEERHRDWRNYLAAIRRRPHEPLFADSFSLAQVYQPLRAWYAEGGDDDLIDERRGQECVLTRPVKRRIVVDAMATLGEWVARRDARDPVRVVAGGPGAGKTSLARMFAATRAEAGERVLFVELHRFPLADDLERAINTYARRAGLRHEVLDYLDATPLLLVFDGLDELSIRGSAGAGAVTRLVEELRVQLKAWNGNGIKVRALLLGREVVVQALGHHFKMEGQLLSLLPYWVPKELRHHYHDPVKQLAIDQRDGWWQSYGRCTGLGYQSLPSSLARVAELTTEPLLNYLVALALISGEVDFSDADTSLTDVYDSFVAQVFRRVHACEGGDYRHSDQRLAGLAAVTLDEFHDFLRSVAVVAWHGEGRTAGWKAIEETVRPELLRKIDTLKSGAEDSISRLIAAFYFRRHVGADGAEHTFEFTHQSFAEYLIAAEVIAFLGDLHAEAEIHCKNSRRGWSPEQQLKEFATRFGPAAIEHNTYQFIVDGLRRFARSDDSSVAAWRDLLSELISQVLTHDFPVAALPSSDWLIDLLTYSRNAGEALLALASACAGASGGQARIEGSDYHSFGSWLRRLLPQRSQAREPLALDCLSHLDLSDYDLSFADFAFAQLVNTSLVGADLMWANLMAADLSEANLSEAELFQANLSEANLWRANLSEANLSQADLSAAILVEANLRGANLIGANLMGANLTDANLSGADLVNSWSDDKTIWPEGFKPRHAGVMERRIRQQA